MTEVLLLFAVILLVIAVGLLLLLLKRGSESGIAALVGRLDSLDKSQERAERTLREELAVSRDELGKATRGQRQELVEAINAFGDSVTQRATEVARTQKEQLSDFSNQLVLFAKASGERLDGVRSESSTNARQLREEVVATLKSISSTMAQTMKDSASAEHARFEVFSAQNAAMAKANGEKLDAIRTESVAAAKQLREEVSEALQRMTLSTTTTMGELASAQRERLVEMATAIEKLSDSNEKKLEAIKVTVEGKLQSMQDDNAKQLDQMRQTVDEKLQGTLEKRLGESFKQVSDRLEQVHKGLGEMQSLATGVGDLKKVLTNVKTRGTWGEVQLGAMLEQILNPDQFASNVSTTDSGERVEFAVKLPGQGGDLEETVWLPIDAKFPLEDYQRLVDAQEQGDMEAVDAAGKQLENRVKASARDISVKYLNPPRTTDFGILFLPTEGLFAEVIRRAGLAEMIQREYRVVIAGPTTLWSILNSLQMGFRTLAIQKRSSEVWNLLGAVKTEWTKYGDVLDTVQNKLRQASDTIEKAKVRSRAVGRKLKDVQELPAATAKVLLDANATDEDDAAESDLGGGVAKELF